ncbi:MAG: cobalt-precorrin-5B (C(1))-methyltransferase CbiD [Fusicatenibacter sp.]|nr:cobalt-precorrin-5B (C(1))-methyltransferase CbiD [Fusicatenibacter sp.]
MGKMGLEDCYVMKGNRKLRCGYTTGSCAAGAARAAAFMLLSGKEIHEIQIRTPKGILLNLEILETKKDSDRVSCAIRKDAGDDPDVTDQALIFASVERIPGNAILVDGGTGVGRVTNPGLDQPVGEAAINRVPRKMIIENIEEIRRLLDEPGGLKVIISVPQGQELAKHTFNPRLGIEGGISILGTSGIVVPMSEEALISTIRVEMEMRKAQGARILLATPGNYGQDFLKAYPWIHADQSIKCSNYVGKTLEFAAELEFEGLLFVAHIGKFVKVSGGIMNTHSHEADCRVELLAAAAVRAGAPLPLIHRLLETGTTEEAIQILHEEGRLETVMRKVTDKISYYMNHHIEGKIPTEAVIFSSNAGLLGMTEGAASMLEKIKEEHNS